MALVADVTFSKKVPGDTQFSSQGFSLTLRTEIMESDPGAIRERLSETFAMVKAQVETELAAGNGKPSDANGRPPQHTTRDDTSRQPASPNQIRFINDLARAADLSERELSRRVKELYMVDSVRDLDKKSASKLITEFKRLQKAA